MSSDLNSDLKPSSAPQPSHALPLISSPHPQFSLSKAMGSKVGSGEDRAQLGDPDSSFLLPPLPIKAGSGQSPPSSVFQESGEACGRGGKIVSGGGGRKSPFPPASAAMDKPGQAQQPSLPPARNTVQRLAEALRLIGTSSAAGEIRSFKSHWLLSHAPDVSSGGGKTARELAPTPPWPPKVGNLEVSQPPWCHSPLFVRLPLPWPAPGSLSPGSSPRPYI